MLAMDLLAIWGLYNCVMVHRRGISTLASVTNHTTLYLYVIHYIWTFGHVPVVVIVFEFFGCVHCSNSLAVVPPLTLDSSTFSFYCSFLTYFLFCIRLHQRWFRKLEVFIKDMEKVFYRAHLLQCNQFFSKETLDWCVLARGNTHLSSLVNYT
jgi:hypothetical protein